MLSQPIPSLVPLRYGEVYCEPCQITIRAGDRVGWWKVRDYHGENVPKSQRWRNRKAVYCKACHRANITARRRREPSPIRRSSVGRSRP